MIYLSLIKYKCILKRNTVRPLKRRKPEVNDILVRTGSPQLTADVSGQGHRKSGYAIRDSSVSSLSGRTKTRIRHGQYCPPTSGLTFDKAGSKMKSMTK